MNLQDLKNNWEELGKTDPYWAVLTDDSKLDNQWNNAAFYETGKDFIKNLFLLFELDSRLLKTKYALDFGCGLGRLTMALADRFENVVGIDISENMINQAEALNKDRSNVSFQVNTTNYLENIESNSFDLVHSMITLQHIEPLYILNYIKEFKRVLTPGGYMIFNLPAKPPLIIALLYKTIGIKGVNRLRRLYFGKQAVIEMHWINRAKLISFFEANNLELVKTRSDNGVGKNWSSFIYLLKKADQ